MQVNLEGHQLHRTKSLKILNKKKKIIEFFYLFFWQITAHTTHANLKIIINYYKYKKKITNKNTTNIILFLQTKNVDFFFNQQISFTFLHNYK